MKLVVEQFAHSAPGLSVIPETEYEAALLARYWAKAHLYAGRASPEHQSANGRCYSITLLHEQQEAPNA